MKNKKMLLIVLLVFVSLFTGCAINKSHNNDALFRASILNNTGSEVLSTKTSESWDQETVNQVLVYRNTEILPAVEGTYFEYKIGSRTIDIMVTGKINPYLDVLKTSGFRVPKNPSIAIPSIGRRSYYGCYSKNDTLKVNVYPVDNEHFEIEATAKLPSGYSDTFSISKVSSRLDELTYFYPYSEPVSPYIIEPDGKIFKITPSNSEYFVVDAYVEGGNFKEYEQKLVTVGYVKDADHKFHMENLGCDIYDIDENNNSYNIRFYVREIPQFDYENYVANYNNGNFTFPVLNGEVSIVLVFNKGTVYCNPPRTLGEEIESQRTKLNYDRVGCTSPTMLHIYGQEKYIGNIYYDFIIDYNFFDRIVHIAMDNSYFIQ